MYFFSLAIFPSLSQKFHMHKNGGICTYKYPNDAIHIDVFLPWVTSNRFIFYKQPVYKQAVLGSENDKQHSL